MSAIFNKNIVLSVQECWYTSLFISRAGGIYKGTLRAPLHPRL